MGVQFPILVDLLDTKARMCSSVVLIRGLFLESDRQAHVPTNFPRLFLIMESRDWCDITLIMEYVCQLLNKVTARWQQYLRQIVDLSFI